MKKDHLRFTQNILIYFILNNIAKIKDSLQ
jgi:hypothetical protein